MNGVGCYSELSQLMKHCICISHGNAVPEQGFSIIKVMLEDRESLKEGTIEAIRLAKESLLLHGNKVNPFEMSLICNGIYKYIFLHLF